ncbi:MAG: DNA polymerase domain-containing protein [Acidobacteria bacterium]|nr:DNA polymerase domain-containing protein [Acidobacteriota bacterium]
MKPKTKGPTVDAHPQELSPSSVEIPRGENILEVKLDDRQVRLTNLNKLFWPELGITKRDLLQYYADVAPLLLPHLHNRAMVMKRYPDGAHGDFFFMKRAPQPRPPWIQLCAIEHSSGNIIHFPVVQDLPSLLWIVNLGCIDLNQWYARCDDADRPDYLHFDLDPVEGAGFDQVLAAAGIVHDALQALQIPNYAKTTGSRGIHIYVPIYRGPLQKEVWTFAKELAQAVEKLYPDLITSQYRVAKRPRGRVLVDYNQNAWGRTLASVYSVRPRPLATVSTPVSWKEIKKGIRTEDFRLDNVHERFVKVGDLWKPLVDSRRRLRLEKFLKKRG